MNTDLFYTEYERLFAIHGLSEYNTAALREKFAALTEYMLFVNAQMNLTAITDEKGVIARHYVDCLFAASSIPAGASVLDVGSGGGMPALPLAIVRPDLQITALDATAKKTAYIEAAAKHIGLANVKVLTGRAEELGRDAKYREKYDVVCARAVAELRILIEWCAPFLKTNGLFLAMKGKNAEEEYANAVHAAEKLSLSFDRAQKVELKEETQTSARENLFYVKNAPVSSLYPRSNAQIQKKPL